MKDKRVEQYNLLFHQGMKMMEQLIISIDESIRAIMQGKVKDPDRLAGLVEKGYRIIKGYFHNVLGIDLDAKDGPFN